MNRCIIIAPIADQHFAPTQTAADALKRENIDPIRLDTAVLFPMHHNPNVVSVMESVLGDRPNVPRVEPLDYPNFHSRAGSQRNRAQ